MSSKTAVTPVTSRAIRAEERDSSWWGVVADQVIRGDGGQVPEEEDQDKVLRHREPDQRTHKQQDKEVKPDGVLLGPVLVMQVQRYVARRIHHDQKADPGSEQGVECGEPVQLDREAQV